RFKSHPPIIPSAIHCATYVRNLQIEPTSTEAQQSSISLHMQRCYRNAFTLALYQMPVLRIYRKHDRILQGPTSWIKRQGFKLHRLPS
ncbi:hypothetical protein L9F63_009722, partial [Diploptera punctata]